MKKTIQDYTCYLFDVDGTLIDTTELIYQSYSYTMKKYGMSNVPRDYIIKSIGLPLKQQLEVFLGKKTDAEMAVIKRIHKDNQNRIYKNYLQVFPHIKEVLVELKLRAKKLAVVTSRKMDTLEPYLNEKGIFDLFDIHITPELTKKHKPDAEPALKALQILQEKPEQTLFIGDSRWDMECGNNAGIDTAFVSWSYIDPHELPVKPTYIINDIRELIGMH